MNKATLFFLSATLLTLGSCGGGDKSEDIENSADTVKAEAKTAEPGGTETFFQTPSPAEMLTFIKMVGGSNNKDVTLGVCVNTSSIVITVTITVDVTLPHNTTIIAVKFQQYNVSTTRVSFTKN